MPLPQRTRARAGRLPRTLAWGGAVFACAIAALAALWFYAGTSTHRIVPSGGEWAAAPDDTSAIRGGQLVEPEDKRRPAATLVHAGDVPAPSTSSFVLASALTSATSESSDGDAARAPPHV